MKKKLIDFVIRYLIRKYFDEHGLIDIPIISTIEGYLRMNDEKILNTLRHRFTGLLASQLATNKETLDFVKGRTTEILLLLEDIEHADERLLKINQQVARDKKIQESLGIIKNKLTGFKTRKPETQ